MFLARRKIFYKLILISFILSIFSFSALAVTQYTDKNKFKFVRSLETFKASLTLPFSSQIEEVPLPLNKLRTRIYKGSDTGLIEPIALTVPKEENKIEELAEKLAKPDHSSDLNANFIEKMKKIGATTGNTIRLTISPEDYKLMVPSKIATEFSKNHYNVTIDGKKLASDKIMKTALIEQLGGFLSLKERTALQKKIESGKDLSIDRDLLPAFARKMVKKFIVYKGPNCFHAALAFHGQQLTMSPFINIKEEEGYHRSMINYDELWRVISRSFYEVDIEKYPLKFGDMIVFFNIPPGEENKEVNFRWIRHTATYIIGPYTFSKGSKSPDTPYTVKTLEEEWNTWLGFSQNLGVKVYRRSAKNPSRKLPEDLVDWIY